VLDRGDAIEHALRAAGAGDVVMVLGRGNLSGELLDRDGRRSPFDDRDEARRALSRISAGLQRA
jgi:UDP-N-acetylmuramoyl-L-alanyl-D-glutamate--2,6-diaminopimelate ligase